MNREQRHGVPLVAAPDWHELMSLFEELIELPKSQRQKSIEQKKLGEATKAKLEKMLKTLDHTMSLLDTPIADRVQIPQEWHADQWVGRQINQYKLDALMHEGNIAAVFAATQLEPVERQVAIKLIRPEASDQYRENFRAEQRALAKLAHPSIASIFTVEESDDGLSFSVMEYIEGNVLSTYCDEQALTIRERLDLFLDICDAVSYAHQRGVLHRDLKSSNILIRNFDGKPTPSVIDLEISSDLNEQIEWPDGYLMGTPEYMSPEHVLDQNNMDVRADVYSMGMVLFTLLAGDIPFDRKRMSKLERAERLALIAEFQTALPAQHLAQLPAEEQAHVIANRSTDLKGLLKELNGELGYIYQKASNKDRELRYSTIAEFAKDVRRYLSNQTVSAHPVSWWYSGKKFLQRNTIASGMSLLLLILGATLSAKIVSQSSAMKIESERAQQEQLNAEQTAEMIINTLNIADPETANTLGRKPVSDMLDQAFQGFRSSEGVSPKLRSRLLIKLSEAFRNTENKDKAREVEQLMLDEFDDYDIQNQVDVLNLLASASSADFEQEKAIAYTEQIEDIYRSQDLTADKLDFGGLARAKYLKSIELQALSQLDLAKIALDEGMSLFEKHELEDMDLKSELLFGAAALADLQNRYEDSSKFYTESIALKIELYGEAHDSVVSAQVVELQSWLGNSDPRATSEHTLGLLERAIQVWGEDGRKTNTMFYYYAWILRTEGKLDQSAIQFEKNLVQLEQQGKRLSDLYVTNLIVLSTIYMAMDAPEKALSKSAEAYQMVTDEQNNEKFNRPYLKASIEMGYAKAQAATGAFEEALTTYSPAIDFFAKHLPNSKLIDAYNIRAYIFSLLGNYESAAFEMEKANRVLKDTGIDKTNDTMRVETQIMSHFVSLNAQTDPQARAHLEAAKQEYIALGDEGERLGFPYHQIFRSLASSNALP